MHNTFVGLVGGAFALNMTLNADYNGGIFLLNR